MSSSKNNLVIIGNGKIAKTLFHYLVQRFEVVCFAVEDSLTLGETIKGGVVDCNFEEAEDLFAGSQFLTCIGYGSMNKTRRRLHEKILNETTLVPANYLCPRAFAPSFVMNGFNNIILDNVTIHPGATLGSNNIIWSQSVISHGASLGHNNWITAGAVISGDCTLGDNNFIGAGAVIAHNITIGNSCYVGANALVNQDLGDNRVVVAEKSIYLPYDSDRFMLITE